MACRFEERIGRTEVSLAHFRELRKQLLCGLAAVDGDSRQHVEEMIALNTRTIAALENTLTAMKSNLRMQHETGSEA